MEAETFRDWLAAHPPDDAVFTQTAAGVARRVLAGEDFRVAVRELLDEFSLLLSDEQRARSIAEEPPYTGDTPQDAYLAALAEHLAADRGLRRPDWTIAAHRFLDRFWFVSGEPGFRALAIVESPASFRRRGIFVSAGSLRRC